MTPTPIIGLLTDFGIRDSYVAQMKGVILSSCNATVVDLSHEIPAFDVFAAGIFLREVAPRFESISRRPIVLVAVVDPGVGSSRRILGAEADGRFYLAPDNGILPIALSGKVGCVDVTNEAYFLPAGSRTFHGRDRFAPVAAALARGVPLSELGPQADRAGIVDLGYRLPDYSGNDVAGEVIRIDNFGNIVTDLEADRIGAFRSVEIAETTVEETASTYVERIGRPEPFVIVGSMGTLEISVANGSAAEKLEVKVRDRVSVSR